MIDNTKNLLKFMLKNYFSDISYAVDMTCGNGYDAKNILTMTNVEKLYAFDIQDQARKSTFKLLKNLDIDLNRFEFILDGHENILDYIEEKIDLAVYNLGYLPRAYHKITTQYKKVIKSFRGLLSLLSKGGVVFITFYPGHKEGLEESIKIPEFLKTLDQKEFTVLKFDFINQKNTPPFCIMVQKK